MIPVLVANQFNAFEIDRYGSCWKWANQARNPAGGSAPNAAPTAKPSRMPTTRVATIRGHQGALGSGGASPEGRRCTPRRPTSNAPRASPAAPADQPSTGAMVAHAQEQC